MPVTVGTGPTSGPTYDAPTDRRPDSLVDATSGAFTTTLPSFGTIPSFPTTPVPLSAGDVQEFAERQSSVSRRFKEALARSEAGIGRAEARFKQFSKRLDRDQADTTRRLGNTLASKGQAFQPRFMGRGLVKVRDEFADRKADARAGLADTVASLGEAARLAELERDEELAAIARDRARRQSALDRLIRPLAGV